MRLANSNTSKLPMSFVRILIFSTKRRNVIARSEYANCHLHHDCHLFCLPPCDNHWTLKVGPHGFVIEILRNCGTADNKSLSLLSQPDVWIRQWGLHTWGLVNAMRSSLHLIQMYLCLYVLCLYVSVSLCLRVSVSLYLRTHRA